MEEGEASGSDRHFAEQREGVKLATACHPFQFGNGVLPGRDAALKALRRVIADRGEKSDNTPPDCFREAPAVADLILEPVDFVRTGGVFSGFPEEGHEVGAESSTFALPGVNGECDTKEQRRGSAVNKSANVWVCNKIIKKEKKSE